MAQAADPRNSFDGVQTEQAAQTIWRRTLFSAALGALAALAFVPCAYFELRGGKRIEVARAYVPVFAFQQGCHIVASQLVVNVVFASIGGAIVASLRKRTAVLVLVGVAVAALAWLVHQRMEVVARDRQASLVKLAKERQVAYDAAVADEKYGNELTESIRTGRFPYAMDAMTAGRQARAAFLNAAHHWEKAGHAERARNAREAASRVVD